MVNPKYTMGTLFLATSSTRHFPSARVPYNTQLTRQPIPTLDITVLVLMSHPQSHLLQSFYLRYTVQNLAFPARVCVLYSVPDNKNDKQWIVASSYDKPEPSVFFFLWGTLKDGYNSLLSRRSGIKHSACTVFKFTSRTWGTQWTSLFDVTLVTEAKKNISSAFLKYGQ